MKYRSTRGAKDNALTSPAAIIQGLAQDGGLCLRTHERIS